MEIALYCILLLIPFWGWTRRRWWGRRWNPRPRDCSAHASPRCRGSPGKKSFCSQMKSNSSCDISKESSFKNSKYFGMIYVFNVLPQNSKLTFLFVVNGMSIFVKELVKQGMIDNDYKVDIWQQLCNSAHSWKSPPSFNEACVLGACQKVIANVLNNVWMRVDLAPKISHPTDDFFSVSLRVDRPSLGDGMSDW